jgi:hypothetical protein
VQTKTSKVGEASFFLGDRKKAIGLKEWQTRESDIDGALIRVSCRRFLTFMLRIGHIGYAHAGMPLNIRGANTGHRELCRR